MVYVDQQPTFGLTCGTVHSNHLQILNTVFDVFSLHVEKKWKYGGRYEGSKERNIGRGRREGGRRGEGGGKEGEREG